MTMIGHVTSSYWSENCGRSIALALVDGGRGRHGRDAATCRCRTGRSRWRSSRRCSSTRRESASMAKAAATQAPSAPACSACRPRRSAAQGVELAVLAAGRRASSLRAPAGLACRAVQGARRGLAEKPKKLGARTASRTRALARPGRMAGHRRERRKDPLADCAGVEALALGGRRLRTATSRSRSPARPPRTRSTPAARRTCRSTPFPVGAARAPCSARSRSCCAHRPKTLSASNAGARSPTMSRHS